MATTVQTSLHYLKRDPLYDVEKPYTMRYQPPIDFPRSNIKLETYENRVMHDIRGKEDQFEYHKDGFEILNFHTSMPYEDFEDEKKVQQIYLKEIADALREALGAQMVQVFEHTIRRRHKQFPISTGQDKDYQWDQPTTLCHIDSTVPYIHHLVELLNGKDRAEKLLKLKFQSVNFWRPLKGPNNDWPLALCDVKCVKGTDLEPCDLVYTDYVVENCQLYFNEAHKWYYLSHQQPHEAIVFRQADSSAPDMPGIPHSAFDNPLAKKDGIPRESIEVRALVFYGDVE